MSLHFDLVLVCDLREDTPMPCIELIQWLCDPKSDPDRVPDFDCPDERGTKVPPTFDFPFLASLPDEEISAVFQRRYRYTTPFIAGSQDVYRYALQFSARHILDDGFYECYLLFIYWLASYMEDGFIGYYKEELELNPTLLFVKDRRLVNL